MEWTDVEDALPPYQERILVCAVKEYETGKIDYLIDIEDRRFTNKDGHYWMNSNDGLRPWAVTHWMHLPKPPKQ